MSPYGYIAIALILAGQTIWSGLRSAAAFVAARMPNSKLPSLAGIFTTIATAKASIEWWKLVAIVLVVLLSRGGGGEWKWPEIPSWPWVNSGADQFIVLHEGTKDDQLFSKLAKTLQDQDSTVGKSIIDAGWGVLVLDDDAEDKDDQPLKLLKSLGVHGSITDAHRELLSVAGGKLLKRETLPADATGESVLAMMQTRGKRK